MKLPTAFDPRRSLSMIARAVFVLRNAARMPAKDRRQLKAKARPQLRTAIHWARQSRNALRAGRVKWALHYLERAQKHLMFAQNALYHSNAMQTLKRNAVFASHSRKGGAATRLNKPQLDLDIASCLRREDNPRLYTKEWAFKHGVSADTVRRRIKEHKARLGTS